jgi:hypothetical protein
MIPQRAGVGVVDSAIELDAQFQFGTVKVEDESGERMLTAKLVAVEIAMA